MDDEAEIGQVEAAGGDIGGDADPGAAVAQRLQGVGALALGQLARQRHGREAALDQAGVEVAHGLARRAEDDRARRLEEAQQVDDRVLALVGGDAQGAILDVAVRLALARGRDPQRVLLVALGEAGDLLGDGGREQERAALGRRGLEDELEILAKAHVEHLVGLVEHDGLQRRDVEIAALEMIAQAAGGADHDVGTLCQRPLLAPDVHAADAGDQLGAGRGVEPGQLALDLQRQLAGGRHHQGGRRLGRGEALRVAEEPGAIASPNATVLPEPVCAETRRSRPAASACSTAVWTGVGVGIASLRQGAGQGGMDCGKRHGRSIGLLRRVRGFPHFGPADQPQSLTISAGTLKPHVRLFAV